MIRRIEIRNFMSHSHTVIEPAEGLTVIVGENNTGKSALISALQVLCRNAPGDYMVRHGSKECSVYVLTDEGDEVEWKRKGRVVSYTINGKEIHRLGGSVPDELHELLNLPLVEAEGDPFDIHFGEQKKPIFLLNESAARRATFFASSSDTIKLIEMQGRHRKNIQEARSRESELTRREAVLTERVDRLAPIDRLAGALEDLEKEYDTIREKDRVVQLLVRDIEILESASADFEKWGSSAAAAGKLCSPPRLEAVEPFERLIVSMSGIKTDLTRFAAIFSASRDLTGPPQLSDTAVLRDLVRQISTVSGRERENSAVQAATGAVGPPPQLADVSALGALIARIDQVEDQGRLSDGQKCVLARLSGPPEIDDPKPLRSLIEKLEALNGDIEVLNKIAADLGRIPAPPEITDPSGIRTYISKIAEAHDKWESRRVKLDAAGKEIVSAEKELKKYLAEAEICPTCGQEIDPEQFIHMTPLAVGRRN